MSCRCGYPGCELTNRPHFCTVCSMPHYTASAAEDCCDIDVAVDDS